MVVRVRLGRASGCLGPVRPRGGRPPPPSGGLGGIGEILGGVLGLMTGTKKVYPFPAECEKELKKKCHSVVRVCHPGEPCNLECMADKPPSISRECQRAHPCSLIAERLCTKIEDTDQVFDCLQRHVELLNPECVKSEPCLNKTSAACVLRKSNEWGGGKSSEHGPSGLRNVAPECQCHSEHGCSRHLHHPFCRPCGENCVQNPLCGATKFWCRVRDSELCNAPFAHRLGHCDGPFPRFPKCEGAIRAGQKGAAGTGRCAAQAAVHNADPAVCPPPPHGDQKVPVRFTDVKIRPCDRKVPTLGSFMRDIFQHSLMGLERPFQRRHRVPLPPPMGLPPPVFPLHPHRFRMGMPLPSMMMDGRPWARPWARPRPRLPLLGDGGRGPAAAKLEAEKTLIEKQKLHQKAVATELARERKEIDRERHEVEVERKTLNPTSAWSTMTKHAAIANGLKQKSGAWGKKLTKWGITIMALLALCLLR